MAALTAAGVPTGHPLSTRDSNDPFLLHSTTTSGFRRVPSTRSVGDSDTGSLGSMELLQQAVDLHDSGAVPRLGPSPNAAMTLACIPLSVRSQLQQLQQLSQRKQQQRSPASQPASHPAQQQQQQQQRQQHRHRSGVHSPGNSAASDGSDLSVSGNAGDMSTPVQLRLRSELPTTVTGRAAPSGATHAYASPSKVSRHRVGALFTGLDDHAVTTGGDVGSQAGAGAGATAATAVHVGTAASPRWSMAVPAAVTGITAPSLPAGQPHWGVPLTHTAALGGNAGSAARGPDAVTIATTASGQPTGAGWPNSMNGNRGTPGSARVPSSPRGPMTASLRRDSDGVPLPSERVAFGPGGVSGGASGAPVLGGVSDDLKSSVSGGSVGFLASLADFNYKYVTSATDGALPLLRLRPGHNVQGLGFGRRYLDPMPGLYCVSEGGVRASVS